MNEILVSIIVPVYNVEKYLDECITSLVNQTYKNIEIILVNDGSKDSSGIKCEKWKIDNDRIKVIHKKNAGLGMARNTGLDHASGDYVIFVDSDDFTSEDMVEQLITRKIETSADTVFCSWIRYYDKNHMVPMIARYHADVFDGNEVVVERVLMEMIATKPEERVDSFLHMSVWHGLYSMKIINENKIRFPSEREFISEDIIYHIEYLTMSNCVAFLDKYLYYYRENNMSLTSVYNPERFNMEIKLYHEIVRRLEGKCVMNDYILRCQRMFLGRVRSCIMRATVYAKVQVFKEIKEICENETVHKVVAEYPYKRNPFRQKIFNSFIRHKNTIGLYILATVIAKKNLRK